MGVRRQRPAERVDHIAIEDVERIRKLLHEVGGKNVVWGARSILEVWLAEARMESERLASQRLLVATWALVGATVALVAATLAMVFA